MTNGLAVGAAPSQQSERERRSKEAFGDANLGKAGGRGVQCKGVLCDDGCDWGVRETMVVF
jgi:hypothetical protein|tara:strand:- start:10468 stop:10650 length:183 start_codon:yes stop_codon:yes gene_type:complete